MDDDGRAPVRGALHHHHGHPAPLRAGGTTKGMVVSDSFGAKSTLKVGDNEYAIHRIKDVEGLEGAATLPYSLKVLLENLVRTEDGENITAEHIKAIADWDENAEPSVEIQFTPARVIMQDFTGVPCIVDLATMREAVAELGGDADRINPCLLYTSPSPRDRG